MTSPVIQAHQVGFKYETTFNAADNIRHNLEQDAFNGTEDEVAVSSRADTPLFGDLTVSIPRGSVYGLLGPNGCGKTTLMSLLLGQNRPSSGRLEVLGLSPWEQPVEVRTRVGLVPQENDLDPKLTVDQTLRFFSRIFGKRWLCDEAEENLKRFGLADRRRHRVDALSGGLKQRLNLVLTMASDPEILLLDEPTAGLDQVVRHDFAESIVDFMATNPERTVVISSHLLSELEPLVDHVGLLHGSGGGGFMLVDGSLEDLKEKVFVARFEDPFAAFETDGLNDFLNPADPSDKAAQTHSQELIPKELIALPGLLTVAQDQWMTSTFWLDGLEDLKGITETLESFGGRVSSPQSLDDIFVNLFQESVPVPGHRVISGELHAQ